MILRVVLEGPEGLWLVQEWGPVCIIIANSYDLARYSLKTSRGPGVAASDLKYIMAGPQKYPV